MFRLAQRGGARCGAEACCSFGGVCPAGQARGKGFVVGGRVCEGGGSAGLCRRGRWVMCAWTCKLVKKHTA